MGRALSHSPSVGLRWEKMEREQRERHQQFLGGVDAIITLLASEGREITAAAIAAILDDPVNYPEDEVARGLISRWRATGVDT